MVLCECFASALQVLFGCFSCALRVRCGCVAGALRPALRRYLEDKLKCSFLARPSVWPPKLEPREDEAESKAAAAAEMVEMMGGEEELSLRAALLLLERLQ